VLSTPCLLYRERDDLEKQVTELKDRNTVLERDFTATARDKKHYEQEVRTL